jgi:hypothetical protein
MKDDRLMMIHKQAADASPASASRFVFSVGMIFAVLGIKTLWGTIANFGALRLNDPIFGTEIRYLLLVVTLGELFVGSLCFVGTAPVSVGAGSGQTAARGVPSARLGGAACLVVNFTFYCAIAWFMGYSHPWVFLTNLMDAWTISPAITNILIVSTALYILTGSIGLLVFYGGKSDALVG